MLKDLDSRAAECLTDEKGPTLFARGWSCAASSQISQKIEG